MKSAKKITTLLLFTVFCFAFAAAGISAAEPNVYASSAVVLDADTGAYYYEKNADSQRTQASMTKLMTAYMIFEEIGAGRLDYDSIITISSHGQKIAYTNGYSNVPLNKGEQYTVDTMLKLILLPSACGACASMADAISGSESAFVAQMNSTARDLGLNARFSNTYGAGVGMPNHYISARSMADLGRIFIKKYPDILKYTSLNSVTFKGRTYKNTNHFLNSDPYVGVDGMKTGTNGEAGSCITVSAQKNGRRIIVVVMKSSDRYGDARKLLDYGFSCVSSSDFSMQNTVMSMGSVRKNIRIGTDFEVYAQMTNVTTDYWASGGWLINGKEVSSFRNAKIVNHGNVKTSLNLDAYAGAPVTIGFYFNLPDGTKKTVEKEFLFSEEEPCAFRDVDGHWAEDHITEMKKTGVLNGYPNGTFDPDNSITRAEFITSFVRLLASFDMIDVTENAQSTFEDCQGHWAEDYIVAAHRAGIAAGRSDHIFDPEEKIARQEIAAFVTRALKYTATDTELTFSDASSIEEWARASVLACVEQQIISGYPDGTFGPHGNATRAEVATILARVNVQQNDKNQ